MFGNQLKVLIADDHALIRKALRQLLADEGLSVDDERLTLDITEAETLDAVLKALAAEPRQLLLIDLLMPGMVGSASLRALRDAHPQTQIVVVTECEDRDTILDCLAAGVHGYVLKSVAPHTITHAIEVVLSGQIYVPPAIANVPNAENDVGGETGIPMPRGASEALPADAVRFTKRQRDVLQELGLAQSTKEIARTLGLREGTVKVHLAAVYRLLNARNRMEAVLLASKLIMPPAREQGRATLRPSGLTAPPTPSPPGLGHRTDLAARLVQLTFQPSSLSSSSSTEEIFTRHSLADGPISELQRRTEHTRDLAGETRPAVLARQHQPLERHRYGGTMAACVGMSILLLEDDDLSRDVIRKILSAAKFEIICARDTHEALELVDGGAAIDLALIDVRMPPGMPHGASFAAMAQLRRPSLRVIFMSACRHVFTLLDDGDIFLRKPFAPQQLLDVVVRAAA
jgi:DNA-binding NarL/FixJ family response regulator